MSNIEFVSNWFFVSGRREFKNQVKPGDKIEIYRGKDALYALYVGKREVRRGDYFHYALYVGTDKYGEPIVVHLKEGRGNIVMDRLKYVVGSDTYRINNQLDRRYPPRSADLILEEISKAIKEAEPYSLLKYNCEHFVNKMRNDKKISHQLTTLRNLALFTRVAMLSLCCCKAPTVVKYQNDEL